jgi:LemA protein
MNGKGILLGIVAILILGVLIVGGGYVSIANDLVAKDEAVKSAWGNVESKLQRRFDLIPNLVETVKGYAAQEKDVLESVTKLRSQWGAAKSVDEKAAVGGQLETALGRLMVISENYPELKSNQNFLELQAELSGTENRISVERDRYNEAVKEYNTAVRGVFSGIVAGMKGMTPKESFKAEDAAEKAPKVKFGD